MPVVTVGIARTPIEMPGHTNRTTPLSLILQPLDPRRHKTISRHVSNDGADKATGLKLTVYPGG
jgi:hypothetical protein